MNCPSCGEEMELIQWHAYSATVTCRGCKYLRQKVKRIQVRKELEAQKAKRILERYDEEFEKGLSDHEKAILREMRNL